MTAEFDQPGDERIAELLIRAWEEGLSASERQELQGLMAFSNDMAPDDFEYAAAALHVALTAPRLQELPVTLRQTILAQSIGTEAPGALAVAPLPLSEKSAVPADLPEEADPRRPPFAWGWSIALAATLLLALLGWLRPGPSTPGPVEDVALQAPPPKPTAAQRRQALLQQEGLALVRAEWSPTDDPHLEGRTLAGDVVWSPERQEGYMRFVGLPSNDPDNHQYQLWVFDGSRDARFPVDGGVFDVADSDDATVVPIRTPIPVRDVQMFAVTLEPPGGVVVSDRDHVLALGKPPEG